MKQERIGLDQVQGLLRRAAARLLTRPRSWPRVRGAAAVHNERVRPPLSRPALSLVVLTTAAALALAGCSRLRRRRAAAAPTSSSAEQRRVPVPVVDGQGARAATKLTDQGSKLSFGDTGTVIFEPTQAGAPCCS